MTSCHNDTPTKEQKDLEAPLLSFFCEHDIAFTLYRHAPVFTVEEAQSLRGEIPGGHAKTLFVRDKKKRRGLVVAEESHPVDLKNVAEHLSMGRISFGSADSLYTMLGVRPGSVTPFGLINCRPECGQDTPIHVLVDEKLLSFETVNFHPLHNAATVNIRSSDLIKFIRACGYDPVITPIGGQIRP